MAAVTISLLYLLSFAVTGFVQKSARSQCSLDIRKMRHLALARSSGSGEVDFQPTSISSSNKRDCSLAVAMAAAILTLPKVTTATTPAALGVDQDGYFERE